MAKAFVAVGAGVLWVSSRLTWINVTASDDKSGESTQPLVGATWSTEIMALSLLLLAGFVASLVLRKTGRRVVGIVCAVAAAAASWAPLGLLAGEPDPARAKSLLTSGVATQNSSAPTTLSDWAQVTDLHVNALGPSLALLGCAVALMGGIVVAMRPGEDTPKRNQYETKAARREKLEEDLADAPESGRVMWDALDEGIDPTDMTGGAGSASEDTSTSR